MLTNELHKNMLNSPVRTIQGRVEVYQDSTLAYRLDSDGALQSIKVERVGDNSKFFGYGVTHKLNFHLRDVGREIDIAAGSEAQVAFGVNYSFYKPFAPMFVTEVHRDEITNALSITAYDKLYKASGLLWIDYALAAPYTVKDVIYICANALGVPVAEEYLTDAPFSWNYEKGGNFNTTDTILDVLVSIAEVTQTIYYLDRDDRLVFKLLDIDGDAKETITKDLYYTLESRPNRRLTTITYATEIGENFTSGTTLVGSVQYIRDNPFLDLLESTTIAERVNGMVDRIGNLTVNQFTTSWRGNYLIEIGDKIGIVTRDNETVCSYLLNDLIEYDGSLIQKTEWNYNDNNENETASNPINITEKINQTYAKVNKIENRIDLVASQVRENTEEIASITLNTDEIKMSVAEIQKEIGVEHDAIYEEIEEVRKQVEMTMSSEELKIAISKELENGVDKVTTSTGYTFDENGLTIEKSGSEMSTIVSEDGMVVRRGYEDVLVANNEGVKAEDLHATTYLIIGRNSRFEDYKDGYKQRTGCFWIGG